MPEYDFLPETLLYQFSTASPFPVLLDSRTQKLESSYPRAMRSMRISCANSRCTKLDSDLKYHAPSLLFEAGSSRPSLKSGLGQVRFHAALLTVILQTLQETTYWTDASSSANDKCRVKECDCECKQILIAQGNRESPRELMAHSNPVYHAARHRKSLTCGGLCRNKPKRVC